MLRKEEEAEAGKCRSPLAIIILFWIKAVNNGLQLETSRVPEGAASERVFMPEGTSQLVFTQVSCSYQKNM